MNVVARLWTAIQKFMAKLRGLGEIEEAAQKRQRHRTDQRSANDNKFKRK